MMLHFSLRCTWQLLVCGGSLSQTGLFIVSLPLATIDPDIHIQGAWSQCKNRNALLQPCGWREDKQFLEKWYVSTRASLLMICPLLRYLFTSCQTLSLFCSLEEAFANWFQTLGTLTKLYCSVIQLSFHPLPHLFIYCLNLSLLL